MVDVELLERVMRHIEAHPEQHDQDVYIRQDSCGTAACFAGWTLLLSGADPADASVWRHAAGAAKDRLGVDVRTAIRLFACTNTAQDLRRMVDVIKADEELRVQRDREALV